MSGMDRSKIIDTLKQRGGFITTGEVKSRSEYEQLRRAIEDGTLMRIRNGVYVEMSALANNMIDVERIVRLLIMGFPRKFLPLLALPLKPNERCACPNIPRLTSIIGKRRIWSLV